MRPMTPSRRSRLSRASALLVCLALAAPTAQADLEVVSVSPAANLVGAATGGRIRVEFDAALDAGTVADHLHVFGRWSGPVPGSVVVAGAGLEFVPARPFFPGEYVTVSLSQGVESASGEPLVGGYTWAFFTGSRPGSDTFVLEGVLDVRFDGEGLIQSYGIYAGDLDGDGAPDFSIPNEVASDVRVLLNDGCGSFSEPVSYALPPSSVPSSNAGADFDGDGDIDLATANIVGDAMSVLLGVGDGTYLPTTTYASGNEARGITALDLEGDGDTDLAVAHRASSNVWLHPNNGDGTFGAPVQIEAGGNGETAIEAADANGDGISDLLVGHLNSQSVTCLTGDGAGGFALSGGTGIGGSPWMLAIGDVDGDGAVDVAGCNFNTNTAGVARGTGGGGFFPAQTYATGNFPLAIDLGDLNADGALDLVVSNYSSGTWSLFQNDGAGTFVADGTLTASIAGSCATLVDYDRDGDMDIVGVDEISDEVFLYTQATSAPSGVQGAACAATLRLDNFAGWQGFGSAPHASAIGESLYLGLSGPAGAPHAFVFGAVFDPALPTVAGLLSAFPFGVLSGAVTDAAGEAVQEVAVPPGLPAGTSVVLQGLLVDATLPSGVGLTNPERVEFQP